MNERIYMRERIWRHLPRATGAVVVRFAIAVGFALVVMSAPALGATITEFKLPYTNFEPYLIIKGPDGNLYSNPWPSLPHTGQTQSYPTLVRISPQGKVSGLTAQALPLICEAQPHPQCTGSDTPAAAEGIATGPDGNLWLTDNGYVDKISPTTGAGDEYYTGIWCGGGNAYSSDWGIAPGQGNVMWFADEGHQSGNCPDPTGAPGYGGLISTDGSTFKETQGTAASPVWITAGPNNDAYWTEQDVFDGQTATPMLGHMTSSGAVNEIPLPAGAFAQGITLGPDGNIWFTDAGNNAIGEYIVSTGKIKEYSAGMSPNADPFQITDGPDGRLYFTESAANKIGAIAPSGPDAGTITEYSDGITPGATPMGITTGPDGNIWFTEFYNDAIGRLSLGNGTISGTVTDADGHGLGGVGITARSSNGSSQSTSTGQDGSYSINVPSGTYTVSPNGSPAGEHPGTPWEVTQCDGTTSTSSCTVEVSSGDVKQASFSAPKDKIEFHFTGLENAPGGGNASIDGVGSAVTSDTTLTDRNDNPISGGIRFSALESPPALVCTSTGLAYPQLDSQGNPTGFAPFDKSTLPIGNVLFTIYAGSEAGPWSLDAQELNRNPAATNSTSLDFATVPRGQVQEVPQLLYDFVKTIKGSGQNRGNVPIFNIDIPSGAVSPGQVIAARTAAQEILLAFLQEHFSDIGNVDFGPVHTNSTPLFAGRAGIEFYTGGNAAVMDVQQAIDIVHAAGLDEPLPAADEFMPSVGTYEQQNGLVVHGHLAPDPSDALTYFGFPYPPLSYQGAVDSQFFSHCVKPDSAQMNLEVDSPVNLVFTNSYGQQFGISPAGKATIQGTGFEQPFNHGKTRRFVLPAGTYNVSLTATGTGTAHVAIFSPQSSSERTQVFIFPVKKDQAGTLKLGTAGATGVLHFAGHTYRAKPGFSLKLHSSHKTLKHGSRRNLVVQVKDQLGRPLAGAVVTASEGRHVVGSELTNSKGTVKLTLGKLKKGKLKIKVTAPGTLGGQLTIRVS